MRRHLLPVIWAISRRRHLPEAVRQVQQIRSSPSLPTFVEALWGYQAQGAYAELTPMQRKSEFLEFLTIIEEHRPDTVLEIGTAGGGSLLGLTRVASPSAILLTVDLSGSFIGGGYPPPREQLYRHFASNGQCLHLLRGDSHGQEMRNRVVRLLEGRRLDLLFIDGDHTAGGVAQDFALYGPLIAEAGVVALHDINPHPEFGVRGFWEAARQRWEAAGARWREIIHRPDRPGYGIGLLFGSGPLR